MSRIKSSLASASLIASVLASAFAASAQTADGDLVRPGAKWYGEFEGYVCDSSQTGFVPRPALFNEMQVEFGKVFTDSTLDNVLLKATYKSGGTECSYSAILFADNANRTAKLVESRVVATSPSASADVCAEGKQAIDEKLAGLDYLYYGHPHRVALMMPFTDAAELCDEGAIAVAPAFVVKGKIQP